MKATNAPLEWIALAGSIAVTLHRGRGPASDRYYDITVTYGREILLKRTAATSQLSELLGAMTAQSIAELVLAGGYLYHLSPIEVMGLRGSLASALGPLAKQASARQAHQPEPRRRRAVAA